VFFIEQQMILGCSMKNIPEIVYTNMRSQNDQHNRIVILAYAFYKTTVYSGFADQKKSGLVDLANEPASKSNTLQKRNFPFSVAPFE
jgi:hypothetical protein